MCLYIGWKTDRQTSTQLHNSESPVGVVLQTTWHLMSNSHSRPLSIRNWLYYVPTHLPTRITNQPWPSFAHHWRFAQSPPPMITIISCTAIVHPSSSYPSTCKSGSTLTDDTTRTISHTRRYLRKTIKNNWSVPSPNVISSWVICALSLYLQSIRLHSQSLCGAAAPPNHLVV